jgi:enoyl-CoA hydratase/carnithine racemase
MTTYCGKGVLFMQLSSILITEESGVALVTLNRPESLNAVNDELRIELTEVLKELEANSNTKVVVVTGAGKAFSAGADLKQLKSLYEDFRQSGRTTRYGGPELAQAFFSFSKPIIAAVNGVAVGWGMTMPLACDIRIASQKARFSAAFVRVGVTPEFGSSYLLPRLIGYGLAAELVFTAKLIGADEALRMGLVNKVVQPDDLLPEACSLARLVAGQPTEALKHAKALRRGGMDAGLKRWVDHEAVVFKERMESEEHYQTVLGLLAEIQAKEMSKRSL